MKKYLNLNNDLNRNDSAKNIEKEIKTKSLDAVKIIKRINGYLTVKGKRDNIIRAKIFNIKSNKKPKNKNTVVNFLTKDDFFFDKL